jgi:hypothetical protein
MNNRYFQYVAGERKGEVLIFDKIVSEGEDVYIEFKDGSRMNEQFISQINQKDLSGKFMAEVDSPSNVWQFKTEYVGREEEKWEQNADGESVCVVPFNPGKPVTHLIPPRPTPKTTSNFGNVDKNVLPDFEYTPPPPPAPIEESYVKIDKSDPVYILMSKAKKIDNEITMSMSISLPPKDLYKLANTSFDEGGDKFISYIVNEITVETIKEAMKLAIRDMYESDNTIKIE